MENVFIQRKIYPYDWFCGLGSQIVHFILYFYFITELKIFDVCVLEREKKGLEQNDSE